MKKNFLLLKALNDIDDDLLIEIEEKNHKPEKNYKIYFFKYISVAAVFMLCVTTFYRINMNNFKKKHIDQGINSNITSQEIGTDVNVNSYIPDSLTSHDIDGKWVNANLMEELNINNGIKFSSDFQLTRQGKIYTKENNNSDEYSKFQEYSLMYVKEGNDITSTIEIYFSKNVLLSDYYIKNANLLAEAKESVINGTKVKIFEFRNNPEDSKIDGFAILECNKYNIFIRVGRITHEEFIELLDSTINLFKTNNF